MDQWMKLLLQVLLKPSNPNLDPELLPVRAPGRIEKGTLLDHLLVMGQPKLILMFVGKLAPVLALYNSRAKMLSLLLLTLILLAYMLVDQPPFRIVGGSGTASAKDSVIW